jgi:hypothetical protein
VLENSERNVITLQKVQTLSSISALMLCANIQPKYSLQIDKRNKQIRKDPLLTAITTHGMVSIKRRGEEIGYNNWR